MYSITRQVITLMQKKKRAFNTETRKKARWFDTFKNWKLIKKRRRRYMFQHCGGRGKGREEKNMSFVWGFSIAEIVQSCLAEMLHQWEL